MLPDTKRSIPFALAMASLFWFTWLLPEGLYWLLGIGAALPNFPYCIPDVRQPDQLSIAMIKSATWVAMQCTFGAIGSLQFEDYPRSRTFVLMVAPIFAMTGVWLEVYSYASDLLLYKTFAWPSADLERGRGGGCSAE